MAFASVPAVAPPSTRERHIEDLLSGVVALARARGGRVVAITVATPPGADLGEDLRARLSPLGYPDVDVVTLTAEGPTRLLSVEYAR